MVMRQGSLFRLSRLRYPEIGEIAAAVAPLLQAGWVDASPDLEVNQLQKLLTKAELLRYFSVSRPYRTFNKSDLVAVLRAQYPGSKPFLAWCQESGDRVYHLVVAPLYERFRLMFFRNFHQDWTEFVLTDLGIFAYETIPHHSSRWPFGRVRKSIRLNRFIAAASGWMPIWHWMRSLPVFHHG
jgi:Fanconi anemia-associated nuclease SAP domain